MRLRIAVNPLWAGAAGRSGPGDPAGRRVGTARHLVEHPLLPRRRSSSAEPVSSSSRLAELRWVNICVEGYMPMSGRSATLELVELSSVRVPTVVAVRTRSALATAKRLCRPSQPTCAVLRVVAILLCCHCVSRVRGGRARRTAFVSLVPFTSTVEPGKAADRLADCDQDRLAGTVSRYLAGILLLAIAIRALTYRLLSLASATHCGMERSPGPAGRDHHGCHRGDLRFRDPR